MKKLIVSILIITLLLSSMAFSINAAPELTQKQAEELVIEAYNRWAMIQEGYGICHRYGEKYIREDYIKADADFQMRTLFDKKENGTSYKNPDTPKNLDYIPITDPRFDTKEKCYSYLEEVFTDEWAEIIMSISAYRWGSTRDDIYKPIRLSDGGTLFSFDMKTSAPWENGVLMILYANTPSNTLFALDDIGKLTVSGNTAQIAVVMEKFGWSDAGYHGSLYDKTVDFEYTANGWRVSGGTLFDYMMFSDWGGKNPLTSDSTVPSIAILGTVAVISLALPVVIYKRRRRVA